jgi:hypothetical protein
MVKAKTEAPRRGRPPGVKNKPKRQVKTPLDKLKAYNKLNISRINGTPTRRSMP